MTDTSEVRPDAARAKPAPATVTPDQPILDSGGDVIHGPYEEVAAALEAIGDAVDGKPVSDFMASIPIVRSVLDLKLESTQRDARLAAIVQEIRSEVSAVIHGEQCGITPRSVKRWADQLAALAIGGLLVAYGVF